MAQERTPTHADLEALQWNVTRMFALFALVLGKVARVRLVETYADGHSHALDRKVLSMADLAGALDAVIGTAQCLFKATVDMMAFVEALIRKESRFAETRSQWLHSDASVGTATAWCEPCAPHWRMSPRTRPGNRGTGHSRSMWTKTAADGPST